MTDPVALSDGVGFVFQEFKYYFSLICNILYKYINL